MSPSFLVFADQTGLRQECEGLCWFRWEGAHVVPLLAEFSSSEELGVVVLSIIMDSPCFLAIPYQPRLMLWFSCPAGLGCCTDFTIKV